MLVLSRRSGESVIIGGNMSVKVLKIKGSIVCLGFDGPKDVNVRRTELMSLNMAAADQGLVSPHGGTPQEAAH